jgi:hypothetical protein
VTLSFDRPPLGSPAQAKLVYDIRSFGELGTADLVVNGQPAGQLPPPESVPGAIFAEWVHRSIDIDPALLQSGSNTIAIHLDGAVHLDRLQMELSYNGTNSVIRLPARSRGR